MKKNTILIISLIIVLLVFFVAKTRTSDEDISFIEEKLTGHVVYDPEEAEIEEPEKPILEEMPPPLPSLPEEQTASDLVYAAKCVDDKIELFLINPTNDTLTIVEDIKIHLNGMIVVDPECSKSTLIPGKKVFCSDISGHLPIREKKENLLQLSIDLEKYEFVIDCENQI